MHTRTDVLRALERVPNIDIAQCGHGVAYVTGSTIALLSARHALRLNGITASTHRIDGHRELRVTFGA